MIYEEEQLPYAQFNDRALSWVWSNLERFDPLEGEDGLEGRKLKALVELAVLCMLLWRRSTFREDARLRVFLERISRVYTVPFFRERPFRGGDTFTPNVWLTVALRACGFLEDEHERRAIQVLIDRGNVGADERSPYLMMELRHLLDAGGFVHRLPSYAALYERSILAEPLNLMRLTDRQAYSITHILFYLSNFGARPITVLSPSHAARTYRLVERMLGMYVHSGNWDLVGELLMSCRCLGQTSSEFYALGWRAFLEAQWPDGAVPGPRYDPQEWEGLDEADKPEYVFEQCYHTTLVAAMAGTLCPREPPAGGEI